MTGYQGLWARVARERCLGGACVIAMSAGLVSPGAHAQDTDTPSEQARQAAPTGEDVTELVVTGSRIARPNLEQPTPVLSLGQELIEQSGRPDLGQILSQQPALNYSGTLQAQQSAGSAGTPGEFAGGQSLANLRGLGTQRTLTLVNGRRQVGSDPGNTAFDLSTISPFLVDRVEVITGGASAVYGSDAVSGVVNIVTRRDFEGLEAELKGSAPIGLGHGQSFGVAAVWGMNLGGGRGNITISGNYDKTYRVEASDVPDNRNWYPVRNPASTSPTDGIPDFLLAPDVSAAIYNYNGSIGFNGGVGNLGTFVFDDAGKPTAITQTGIGTSNIFGLWSPTCARCFALEDWSTTFPPSERTIVSARGQYQLSDADDFSAEIYGSYTFAKRSTEGDGQPLLSTGVAISVTDNPFLDAGLRSQLLSRGITTTAFSKGWADLGGRGSKIDRATHQVDTGIRGTIATGAVDLKYDIYGQFGHTNVTYIGSTRFYRANIAAALDAVRDPASGQIKCRMDVPALQPSNYVRPNIVGGPCVPLNPFGRLNDPAAAAFVTTKTVSHGDLEQRIGGFSLSGDTEKFLTLFGGGAIGFAGGFEYRKEQSSAKYDPKLLTPITTQVGLQTDFSAQYHVNEFFFEMSVPIARDLPLVHLLSIDGAVRTAKYSHAGRANAYKIGGIYAPIEDFRIRGTWSRAVRAPNITEAFLPSQLSSSLVTDPCSPSLINATAQRRANCEAIGMPANFVVTSGNTSVTIDTVGNPDLASEKSTSFTVGAVATPRFLPRFTASIDYYDIEIKDAIAFQSASASAAACVDGENGPVQTFCGQVVRETNAAAPNFFNIIGGKATYQNGAKRTARGVDFQVNYSAPLASGNLSLRVAGSRLLELRDYPYQTNAAQYIVQDEYLGNPKWKVSTGITFTNDDWTIGWTGRYFTKQRMITNSPGVNQEQFSPNRTPAAFYNDIYVERRFALLREVAIYVGANNIFDKKMPIISSNVPSSGTVYEPLGVVAFGGVKVKF